MKQFLIAVLIQEKLKLLELYQRQHDINPFVTGNKFLDKFFPHWPNEIEFMNAVRSMETIGAMIYEQESKIMLLKFALDTWDRMYSITLEEVISKLEI